MSTTQQFPVHTGTFTTKRGAQRTMNFIKVSDLPASFTSVSGRARKMQPGFETVYDIDKGQYRTFNHNLLIGSIQVSYRNITI